MPRLIPFRLNEDVLKLIALECSVHDLRRMRAASWLFCSVFTPFAFRNLTIWCNHPWTDAIDLRMEQLAVRYPHFVPYVHRITLRFGLCDGDFSACVVERSTFCR
jgi:hypothetical protein